MTIKERHERNTALGRTVGISALITSSKYTPEQAAETAAIAARNIHAMYPTVPIADIEAYIFDK